MFENIPAWLAVIVSSGTLIFAIYSARSKATAHKVSSIEGSVARVADRVDKLEDRATSIEGDLKHLPNRNETHGLQMSLMELSAKVDVLAERIKPVAAIADRVQEVLLDRADRNERV